MVTSLEHPFQEFIYLIKWIFWQIGYPLGILLYVLIDRRYRSVQFPSRVTKCILFLLPVTVIPLVVLLTYIAIDPYHLLPAIEVESSDAGQSLILGVLTRQIVFGLNALMCIATLLLLHQRQGLHLRFHGSILHLWLRTSTVASLVNVTFSVVHIGGRYSIGWYVARTNGLMTAIFVLCALLMKSINSTIAWPSRTRNWRNRTAFRVTSSRWWDTSFARPLPASWASAN